jgi:hypothetical protein
MKMNEFNMSDFEKNTTIKYRSCVTYEKALSPETLTRLFENGWKIISFNGFGGTKELGMMRKDNVPPEAFAYMFENRNFNDKKND